ncbi:hypothetical protein N7517_003955 [Penicillium concentricum]|uniref:Uncharacterized protein n=1 Tax=Penicillium concentricum TaxID=293559 RepID=A0A9W9V8X7_9EURO|nr:uncharacterized protein N7517_003955 [Penicillium concentricum]KAJ5371949.1 hypothetical protein N7517_003955 [Penicillium concentricum]
MAWWDSSAPGYIENLMPTYIKEICEFRSEVECQIDILVNYPGHQQLVSEKLIRTARSMRKIKTLASDISVYLPSHEFVAAARPGFYQTTFPRVCDFIEQTMIELSKALVDYPECDEDVASQLQDLLNTM